MSSKRVADLTVGDRILDLWGTVCTVTQAPRRGAARDILDLGLDGQESPYFATERVTVVHS